MILFLWECKQSGGLSEVNPHFTPQLLSKKQLHTISSCSSGAIRLFPLKVESFRNDLDAINKALEIDYIPRHTNSTSLPHQDWTFSDWADLVDLPLSRLYAEKSYPNQAVFAKHSIKTKISMQNTWMCLSMTMTSWGEWTECVKQGKIDDSSSCVPPCREPTHEDIALLKAEQAASECRQPRAEALCHQMTRSIGPQNAWLAIRHSLSKRVRKLPNLTSLW